MSKIRYKKRTIRFFIDKSIRFGIGWDKILSTKVFLIFIGPFTISFAWHT